MRRRLGFVLPILSALIMPTARAGDSLSIDFQGRSVTAPRASVFAMPGETIAFVVNPEAADGATIEATIGSIAREQTDRWHWSAPNTPGSYGMLHVVGDSSSRPQIDLTVFVLVPTARVTNGYVGEFRVDAYPRSRPDKNPQNYAPPIGFVEVTEANRDLYVSPHFKIGQFVSKQVGDWPKYVVPSDRLYAKLEGMVEAVQRAGFEVATLHVMSGYRTPYYNRTLGNVPFSRHIYGDAADVFVDVDEDEYMDDLNGDGVVDVTDAVTMAEWLEALAEQPAYFPFAGGLGVYDATQFHGPFIHVDARGHDARWGLQP